MYNEVYAVRYPVKPPHDFNINAPFDIKRYLFYPSKYAPSYIRTEQTLAWLDKCAQWCKWEEDDLVTHDGFIWYRYTPDEEQFVPSYDEPWEALKGGGWNNELFWQRLEDAIAFTIDQLRWPNHRVIANMAFETPASIKTAEISNNPLNNNFDVDSTYRINDFKTPKSDYDDNGKLKFLDCYQHFPSYMDTITTFPFWEGLIQYSKVSNNETVTGPAVIASSANGRAIANLSAQNARDNYDTKDWSYITLTNAISIQVRDSVGYRARQTFKTGPANLSGTTKSVTTKVYNYFIADYMQLRSYGRNIRSFTGWENQLIASIGAIHGNVSVFTGSDVSVAVGYGDYVHLDYNLYPSTELKLVCGWSHDPGLYDLRYQDHNISNPQNYNRQLMAPIILSKVLSQDYTVLGTFPSSAFHTNVTLSNSLHYNRNIAVEGMLTEFNFADFAPLYEQDPGGDILWVAFIAEPFDPPETLLSVESLNKSGFLFWLADINGVHGSALVDSYGAGINLLATPISSGYDTSDIRPRCVGLRGSDISRLAGYYPKIPNVNSFGFFTTNNNPSADQYGRVDDNELEIAVSDQLLLSDFVLEVVE
jgi:hypothetical protein